jgi:multidrug efflux system membrane fusion protein
MASSSRSQSALVWLVLAVALGLSLWLGWKALRDAEPEAGGPRGGGRPPSVVIVKPALEKTVVENLTVTGTLRAVRRAEVAARESGAVDAIAVDEGDLVEKDAVLARLDGRRLEAQVQEAEADLTAAVAERAQRQAEWERAISDEKMMRELWDEQAVAEREYLDSVRGLKVAEARADASGKAIDAATKRLDLLKVRRGDLEVRAPFGGRVVVRHVEPGEWLREGDPVATILSTMEAEAWLQVPERHAMKLRETAPEAVVLRVPGMDVPIRADRLQVVPDINGRSRLFVLVAHIPDPDNQLTPGLSVEASVPLGKAQPQMVVSTDAIMRGFAGTHVFVPRKTGDGPPLAVRVPVVVLFERRGEAILAPGALEPGTPVIVEGNERLFPNTPVDPRPWEETRAPESPPESAPQP